MKKSMIVLVLLLTMTFVGCDFLSNSEDTTTLPESTTSSVSEVISTVDNEHINQTANTDDVAYEDLFDDANFKKMTLYFNKEDLIQLIENMERYNSIFGDEWTNNYRDNTTIPVDVVYEDGNGNSLIMNEVGYRTKGNIFSRVPPGVIDEGNIVEYLQCSFQLEFNNTFDYAEGSTMYNYYQTREFFDLEQLNFKRIQSGDFAVVTESLAYDLFREVGVKTSNTSYTAIYFNVDGEIVPYGLFLIQEVIDDVFAEMYYGENPDGTIGEVYKCTWQSYGPATLSSSFDPRALGITDWTTGTRKSYALKTNKDAEDFSSFNDFLLLANDITNENYYQNLANSLDVDSFARALAMHFLVGSPDDYRTNANNYYMYFNEGLAYYIPFDFDNSLGYGWNPFGDRGISLDIDSVQIVTDHFTADSVMLVYYLLQEATFRDMYLNYLDLYTSEGTYFTPAYAQAEYDLIQSLYESEIVNNSHLGLNYFNFNDRWEAMTISDYINDKTTEVRRQLTELGY